MANGNYPRASHFYDIRELSGLPGSPEPGQKASGTCSRPALSIMSVVIGNLLNMENLQGFEGLSALEESAVRLHEIYKSLMTGGFTEDEALSLIAKMTRNSPPS